MTPSVDIIIPLIPNLFSFSFNIKYSNKATWITSVLLRDVPTTKFEKLKPSLEPSHAFSVAIAEAKRFSKDTIVVVNSCGDAYKDRAIIERRLGKKYV